MSRSWLTLPLLLLTIACGDAGSATGAGGAAASSAGAATVPGGGSASSSGGAGNSGGPAVAVTLAGSGQAVGGGDQGSLFPTGVAIMPPDVGGSGGSGGGAQVIPGDGNMAQSTLDGTIKGTATFTQTAEDVLIVVDLTSGCADGNHRFTVHTGGSCDDATTDGDPWSPRGTQLGNDIACSGGKGQLNYTRKGDDKSKNLTVGDHTDTDVTQHVVIISDEKDLNSRASCGNFFF